MNRVHRGAGLLLVAQVGANALVGFMFQRMLAWRFGVSVEKSAFDIAFSVPFTLMYLSGLAMAHTVIVAYFIRIASRDLRNRAQSFSTILNISLLTISAMVVVGLLNVDGLTRLLAPGFDNGEQLVLRQLLLILLPLSIPLGVGMLTSAASFASGLPMSQELLLLIARLLVMLVAVSAPRFLVTMADISVFLLLCSLVLVIIQIVLFFRSTGLRWVPSISLSPEDRGWLVSRLTGFVLISFCAQAASIYYRSEGTTVSVIFIAAIGFAVTVIEPIGTAFGRVIVFVNAHKQAHTADHSTDKSVLNAVLRTVLIAASCGAAMSILISAVTEPIIELLYGGGKVTAADLGLVADVARVYCWTLPASAASWAILTFSISQGRYTVAVVYVSGYLAQIVYLWIIGPGQHGYQLLLGYLIPVWWQAVALMASAIMQSNRGNDK